MVSWRHLRRALGTAVLLTTIAPSPAAAQITPAELDGVLAIIPNGAYHVQTWAPAVRSDSVFIYVLTVSGAPKGVIFEPFFVVDVGPRQPAEVTADIKAKFGSALKSGDVIAEPLSNGEGRVVGYVVRHREVSFAPRFARGDKHTLYLRGPGTVESGGGGGGSGGGAGGR